MKKIFVAIAGGAVLALTTSGLMAGPAGAATTAKAAPAATASCAQILFVGARGSGQPGPGKLGWKPTKSDPYGLGQTVASAYNHFKSDLDGEYTIRAVSVPYQANSVPTAGRAPNEYFNNLGLGVQYAMDILTSAAKKCPDQGIVLAGYSQGAMVMHRTVHDLINGKTKTDTAILNRMDAAILIADGDDVRYDNETDFGTAGRGADGIGHWFPKISHSPGEKFPTSLTREILRVCNHHDPVCDATEDEFGVSIHTSYANSTPLVAAAEWAALNVEDS
jgi:cutinase